MLASVAFAADLVGECREALDLGVLLRGDLREPHLVLLASGDVLAVGALVFDHVARRLLVRPVEVQHTGDRLVEQLEVVADDKQRAAVPAQELHEPRACVDVEVVRRLVEEEDVAPREQDAGELDPASLSAGEHREREVDAVALDAETRDERAHLRLRPHSHRRPGTPPLRREKRATFASLWSSSIARRSFSMRTVAWSRPRPDRTWVERGDAVEEAGDAGVLREVAERALTMHDADRGGSRTPEHAQQARLARTVAADEADLVAGADRQRGAFDDETAADLNRQLAGLQHEVQGYEDAPRFSVPFDRDP